MFYVFVTFSAIYYCPRPSSYMSVYAGQLEEFDVKTCSFRNSDCVSEPLTWKCNGCDTQFEQCMMARAFPHCVGVLYT